MVLGEQCDRISVLGLHSEVMVLSLHRFCSTCTSTTCLADQLWFVTHTRRRRFWGLSLSNTHICCKLEWFENWDRYDYFRLSVHRWRI